MDREKAIQILKRCEAESYCSHYKRHYCCIGCGQREALDLAIEALKREIEYGQMVVDFTKGETMKSNEWKYDTTCDAETATTTDCISRADIEYHTQLEAMGNGEYEEVEVAYKSDIDSLPPVIPPRKVVAEIKVDTEELVKRIKEEYQIEQEHGRLIDADKLLQELFTVDEEEWTTPEIRTILENAPTAITPTERTGEWAVAYLAHESVEVRPRTLYCSECNWLTSFPSAWCPNCGAKMKGGTENE